MTDLARLRAKFEIDERECWMWQGATARGYGYFFHEGRMRRAHRVAYELLIGPIPDGLDLDHLCRRPLCVNPAHLEPVTRAENLRRVTAEACRKGHPWTEDSTYVSPAGSRQCRVCRRVAERLRSAA